MATAGYNSPAKQLTSYIRWYLERHPEVSWQQLLQSAVQHEIQGRVQDERCGKKPRPARKLSIASRQSAINANLSANFSAQELAGQTWIDERLNAYYARKSRLGGLFSSLSRLVFG